MAILDDDFDEMIQRSFLPTRLGIVHAAQCGAGLPILLLHQTPRSWDEYRDVLPRLGRHARTIAMDTPGFGDSPGLPEPTIERWADTALAVLDALGLPLACVAGHHTGAVIACELAARAPERVAALVLSSCPMVDAARRQAHAGKTPVDTVTRSADGAHLLQFWQGRQPFYPPGDTALLDRYVVDALRAGPMAAAGHGVVNAYRMEDRIGLVRAPTLVLAATADPHAFPATPRIAAAIPGATVTAVAGGNVPFPDAMPAAWSDAVLAFLRRAGLLAPYTGSQQNTSCERSSG